MGGRRIVCFIYHPSHFKWKLAQESAAGEIYAGPHSPDRYRPAGISGDARADGERRDDV